MRVIGNSSVFYADINSSNLLSCVRVLIKLLLLRSKQNNVVHFDHYNLWLQRGNGKSHFTVSTRLKGVKPVDMNTSVE